MCGLNGVFAYGPGAPAPSEGELLATRDHMHTRGPDGASAWWSADRRIGLGHRRLSIIDLSERGAQPMVSEDGSLTVAFNGEIYNYPQLRRELERQGVRFRTNSDTEVLLHLYARDGRAMTAALRGMYAFAIWDARQKGVFLARDPYGIKPLYLADDGKTLRFASQVKALLAGGQVSRDPEPAGVVGFHLFGSVPEPFTLYRAIRALTAGHSLWADAAGVEAPRAFFSVPAVLAEGARQPVMDIVERVQEAVLDSVRAHLLADVEVGVFLSAGVDSGALLGLMRDAGAAKNIRAITLGFDEFVGTSEDEAPLAAKVAAQYGAEHHVRRVGEAEFRADLPAIFSAMDQPSIDGINTWFVSKAAKESGLKVALSGLGGDEILGGYPSFRDIPRMVRSLKALAAIPGLGVLVREASGFLPGLPARSPKMRGLVEYGGDYAGAYLLRRGLFLPFELKAVIDPQLVREGLQNLRPLDRLRATMQPDPGSAVGRVAALESQNYMRNQLLRDSDWAGMAHSLEIRTPLVDVDLLQVLAPVVPHLGATVGKVALGGAPSLALPDEIVNRPKTGFAVPTGRWLAQSVGAPIARKGAASRVWASRVFAEAGGGRP